MVAHGDPKDKLILAWSFEHTRGQEIMIEDDYHHTGRGYLYAGYREFCTIFKCGQDGDETLKTPVG